MFRRIHHIMTKTPLIFRVVSLYVLVIGVTMIPQLTDDVASTNQTVVQARVETDRSAEPILPLAIEGNPVQLAIPSLGLERQIVPGQYDVGIGDWTLTDDKIQFATMTGRPSDQPGQTLLYGHNTAEVLEPVRLLKPGDQLIVTTENGHKFQYIYTNDRTVKPTDTSVLFEQPDKSRLVLMTCEGVFSSTRRLLYFDLQGVA